MNSLQNISAQLSQAGGKVLQYAQQNPKTTHAVTLIGVGVFCIAALSVTTLAVRAVYAEKRAHKGQAKQPSWLKSAQYVIQNKFSDFTFNKIPKTGSKGECFF